MVDLLAIPIAVNPLVARSAIAAIAN